jgi:hypothetical protein
MGTKRVVACERRRVVKISDLTIDVDTLITISMDLTRRRRLYVSFRLRANEMANEL